MQGYGPTTFAKNNWQAWYGGTGGLHAGLDITAPVGAQVTAGLEGEVVGYWKSDGTKVGKVWGDAYTDGDGNVVGAIYVRAGNKIVTYGHVKPSDNLELGPVNADTKLGTVADMPGAHLHLSVFEEASPHTFYNPYMFMTPNLQQSLKFAQDEYPDGLGPASIESIKPGSPIYWPDESQ